MTGSSWDWASVVAGFLSGMLLLESKEEHTLEALRVSPLSVRRLLWIEALLAYGAGVLVILVQAIVVGVGRPPLGPLVVIALSGATFAPVVAIGLARQARDKVEAFAALKIVGIVALAAPAASFLPEPWQWIATLVPPYAAAKAWWLAAAGSAAWPAWALVGIGFNAAVVWGLIRRF